MKARPPLERLAFIARRLRAGKGVNATIVAARFEVSSKTAARDITFLGDRLRYDFAWDNRRNTYRLLSAPAPVL
ncbi:MAG: hypothetical protein J0L84_02130 [Verrucomicrobia bacterium]|nr:hypothetical protein [Verrucomicrobiota bacterium]